MKELLISFAVVLLIWGVILVSRMTTLEAVGVYWCDASGYDDGIMQLNEDKKTYSLICWNDPRVKEVLLQGSTEEGVLTQ